MCLELLCNCGHSIKKSCPEPNLNKVNIDNIPIQALKCPGQPVSYVRVDDPCYDCVLENTKSEVMVKGRTVVGLNANDYGVPSQGYYANNSYGPRRGAVDLGQGNNAGNYNNYPIGAHIRNDGGHGGEAGGLLYPSSPLIGPEDRASTPRATFAHGYNMPGPGSISSGSGSDDRASTPRAAFNTGYNMPGHGSFSGGNGPEDRASTPRATFNPGYNMPAHGSFSGGNGPEDRASTPRATFNPGHNVPAHGSFSTGGGPEDRASTPRATFASGYNMPQAGRASMSGGSGPEDRASTPRATFASGHNMPGRATISSGSGTGNNLNADAPRADFGTGHNMPGRASISSASGFPVGGYMTTPRAGPGTMAPPTPGRGFHNRNRSSLSQVTFPDYGPIGTPVHRPGQGPMQQVTQSAGPARGRGFGQGRMEQTNNPVGVIGSGRRVSFAGINVYSPPSVCSPPMSPNDD
ncbi:hypothetical protein ABEF95_010973 [Exophiala dermatitidis]